MRGTTPRREQGMADPVLASMVHAMGLESAPHYSAAKLTIQAYRNRWAELAKFRDGPVNPQRIEVNDPAGMARQIKDKAMELGADLVGICRLQPHMIDLGKDVPHEFAIASCVAEDYEKVLQGANAVEEEAMRVYAHCAEIATDLAAHIRSCGYPARAHHNGGREVQAIPHFLSSGFWGAGTPRQFDPRKIWFEFSPGNRHHRSAARRRPAP